MPKEQYYLFLITKNKEYYRVHSKPVSLEKMDERTTKYKGERTLIKQIISNVKTTLAPDDVEGLFIMRCVNQKKEEYKKERGPLYSKDADVLNENMTLANLELRVHDKDFVRYLLKPYSKIKNFRNLYDEIIGLMNNDSNYSDELHELLSKVTKTYKGSRNIYFTMKNYDREHGIKKLHFDLSLLQQASETDDDIIIDELEYLKKYERELLDIEDFRRHQSISPFDNNPKKIR